MAKQQPPAGLGARGRALWREILGAYALDAPEMVLLTETCRTLATVEALEAKIRGEGHTIAGSKGQIRVHPAVAEARQQRLALGRLLAQLDFPDAEIDSPAQTRARHAADARWMRKERFREGA